MSLNCEYKGASNVKTWSRADWTTYNALIWTTMAVHIGTLNEASAAEFCRRANALRLFPKRDITPKDIAKFYGLETNVSTLSGPKWAALVMSERHTNWNAWKRGVYKEADALRALRAKKTAPATTKKTPKEAAPLAPVSA